MCKKLKRKVWLVFFSPRRYKSKNGELRCCNGELPGYKIGGQYRIKPAELEAWISEQAIGKVPAAEGGNA